MSLRMATELSTDNSLQRYKKDLILPNYYDKFHYFCPVGTYKSHFQGTYCSSIINTAELKIRIPLQKYCFFLKYEKFFLLLFEVNDYCLLFLVEVNDYCLLLHIVVA